MVLLTHLETGKPSKNSLNTYGYFLWKSFFVILLHSGKCTLFLSQFKIPSFNSRSLLRNCFRFSIAHCGCSARLKQQLDTRKQWKCYRWSSFLNGKEKYSLWRCRMSTSLLFPPSSIIPNVRTTQIMMKSHLKLYLKL